MLLGISLSHCATACIVDDNGNVLFCGSEERFTRRKNEWGIPHNCLRYIFSYICEPAQIEKVLIGEACEARYGSDRFAEIVYLRGWKEKDAFLKNPLILSYTLAMEVLWKRLRPQNNYQDLLEKELKHFGIESDTFFFNHHKAHAAGAYYSSPFKKAMVVTLDGEGDGLSGSVWYGENNELAQIHLLPDTSSIGKYYRAITSATGFKLNRHEGKITGLAAYGDPRKYYNAFKSLLYTELNEHGEKTVVSKIADYHLRQFNLRNMNLLKLSKFFYVYLSSKGWEDLINKMFRQRFRNMYSDFFGWYFEDLSFQEMADFAASAQFVMEETVIDYIKFYLEKYPVKQLVLSGGVFANVKLNQRIWEQLNIEEVYVHPGMGDEGLSLGAAMAFYHENHSERCPRLNHVHLGPAFSDSEIENALKESGLVYERKADKNLVDEITNALIENKIIGIYHGRMEYGPRALGHRTILVNPMRGDINEVVNKRLGRTEFMPFAPVVLDRCFSKIFMGKNLSGVAFTSKFMTITLDVKPEWRDRIPGVVHVDCTARPQIISREDDPFYYQIIEAFLKRTGIGCLVNTSFNIHEEPIVNTPDDAIRSFKQNAVDILVMEKFIVKQQR